jgi:uncharacterized protein (TIGR02001 family)
VRLLMAGCAALLFAAAPTRAQVAVDAGVALASDERRRGLSWSDGELSPSATVALRLAGADIGVRVTGTRGDPRHGGADAVADVTAGYGGDIGSGLRLDGFVAGHLFAGAGGRLDYVEGGAGASYALGPAEIGIDARYAPDQAAIGGDNLYVAARARVGIPATPYTVAASVGRSAGQRGDAARAARLRPGGDYVDWSLGVDRIVGPLTIGIAYTGTDIAARDVMPSRFANRRDTGDRIAARVAFGF